MLVGKHDTVQCRLFIRQFMYGFLWIKELGVVVRSIYSIVAVSMVALNDCLLVNFVAQYMMVWDAV